MVLLIWAISYGNEKFLKSRDFNLKSAIKNGKADRVIAYGPEDIDEEFKKKHQDILKEERGNGYWLWKPYIVLKTLNLMDDGDYLMYCDAGAFYKNKIQRLIYSMESENQNIMCFYACGPEKEWTKRDAFILMSCDSSEYTDTTQVMATCFIVKKCNETYDIIEEWLNYAKDRRIISDDENTMGYPNYPNFSENRHDQSIWSLVTKKHKITAFRDPSQFGNNIDKNSDIAKRSKYNQIFIFHRNGDIDSYFKLWKHMSSLILNYLHNGNKFELLCIGIKKLYKKIWLYINVLGKKTPKKGKKRW